MQAFVGALTSAGSVESTPAIDAVCAVSAEEAIGSRPTVDHISAIAPCDPVIPIAAVHPAPDRPIRVEKARRIACLLAVGRVAALYPVRPTASHDRTALSSGRKAVVAVEAEDGVVASFAKQEVRPIVADQAIIPRTSH